MFLIRLSGDMNGDMNTTPYAVLGVVLTVHDHLVDFAFSLGDRVRLNQ